ncbi:glycosyltransferase family 2 protein [Candidatus Uhrbacteria bacterium]|nr:glycosyltransferase family 2 protein [Candidatus Uhrbacteria bacterium]
MTTLLPKVAVQYLAYLHPGAEKDIEDCFCSLEQVSYPHDRWHIVVVDNPYGDDCRAEELFRTRWMPKARRTLPEMTFVRSEKNTGFAGGHVAAHEAIRSWEPDFLYLLNQDTVCDPGFLEEAVRVAASDPRIATVQSRVMLKQEPFLLNSCGNCLHVLGFGFSDGYRRTPEDARRHPRPHFFNSGAGLLVRTGVLEAVGGLFDPAYFMYHDDVDLAWRARLAGYRHAYAEASVIYHRYEFSRSIAKFYLMERNRLVTHASRLRLPTLLLMLLPLLVMEGGTAAFAWKSGWLKEKCRVWAFFFLPSTWSWIRRLRRQTARIRRVPDREILRYMVGRIEAQEIENPLLKRVVNPLMVAYFFLLKAVVRW